MLFVLAVFIRLNVVHHVILPTITTRRSFVNNLVKYIIEIVDRINYFSNIGALSIAHRSRRIGGRTAIGDVAVDAIDVVALLVRMPDVTPNVEPGKCPLFQFPAVEEHYGNIDTVIPRLGNAL